MKNRYFKGFNHFFGRARKSTAQTLKEPLNEIRGRVCEKMMPSGGILDGRRVMVVDAASVQLEDTARNQQ